MKSKSLINLSLVALSIANVVLIVSAAQAQLPPVVDSNNPETGAYPNSQQPVQPPVQPPTTNLVSSVRCENLTTTIYQGEAHAVLFQWNTNFFGANFTPAVRCQVVSDRLNSFVRANNGQFSGISFITGLMNNYPVICSPRPGESSCNSQNLLFTLKPENRAKADEIIRGLQDPNSYGSFSINEARRPKADLGEWAKRNLRQNSINRRYPQNSSQPVPSYSQPVQSPRPRFK